MQTSTSKKKRANFYLSEDIMKQFGEYLDSIGAKKSTVIELLIKKYLVEKGVLKN